jgi:hypothetical protein
MNSARERERERGGGGGGRKKKVKVTQRRCRDTLIAYVTTVASVSLCEPGTGNRWRKVLTSSLYIYIYKKKRSNHRKTRSSRNCLHILPIEKLS